jgi:hypothetical protein
MGRTRQRVPETEASRMRGDLCGTRQEAQKARLQGDGSLDYEQTQMRDVFRNIHAGLPCGAGIGGSKLRRYLVRSSGATC